MSTRNSCQRGTRLRRGSRIGAVATLALIGVTTGLSGLVADAESQTPGANFSSNAPVTATPIQHLVVIYDENISFDHYFGTYPNATNVAGEPPFTARSGTPTANNYVTNPTLLTSNPNLNPANGTGATNPFRLDRTQAASADQNHNYTPEQEAFDNFKMDLFPKDVGSGTAGGVGAFGTTGLTLGYYDGNTVTAWWNYAQNFAMSDNSFGDQFGPSTPGAVNLISGQTNGVTVVHNTTTTWYIPDGQNGLSDINDADPAYDTCSIAANGNEFYLSGKNIGDLLNAAGITWGSFMGGFNLSLTNTNGTTGCARSTFSIVVGAATADYIQHHAWFQYFASTVNPSHARPSTLATIGHSYEPDGVTPEPANHAYDLLDFYSAVGAGNFPAVSFIKMPAYQDGHAGYSDPLDEQAGVVALIDFLQQQPQWSSTAVIIAYDDSDGWYDHAFTATTSPSFNATVDQLNGAGICGSGTQQNGVSGYPVNGRCGPGPRLPFVVISPWAKQNYVSHVQISQVSVTRFIEDNWLNGQRLGGGSFDANAGSIMDLFNFASNGTTPRRFLNPTTGSLSSALTHDFNDDGYSDILWRDTSGDTALWLMNGGSVSQSAALGTVPSTLSIIGQHDFNGDGNTDILWRDTSGNVSMWFMNGTAVASSAAVGNLPSNWTLYGTGDLNGDGIGDLLWRDSNTGTVSVWFMNGATVASTATFGAVPTSTWTIVGEANGYILWRDTAGDIALWQVSGGKVSGSAGLGNVPSNFVVQGVGDFNGDGYPDILWRDTNSNTLSIWFTNGQSVQSAASVGTLPSNWNIAQIGGYAGPSDSDILLLDSSGDLAVWEMNGATVSSSIAVTNVGTTWQVQNINAN
jgi:phospholipase C